MGGKDQHRLAHGLLQPAKGVQDSVVILALNSLNKDVLAFVIQHRDMEMHARACVILIRFGHETGGDAVQSGVHAHEAFQAHQVIGGLQDVFAVMQRQLILARRKFGDQGFGLNACGLGACVDVVEKGQHAVQLVHRIDIGFGIAAAVQHIARRDHLTVGVAVIFQKEKLQLKRACGVEAFGGHCIHLPLQGVAGVRGHLAAVKIIQRHEHFAAGRVGAHQRHQRAGDGPSAAVAVALIPDQAGFMHILATDIEAQNGNRHMAAGFVDRQKFMAADDLAAPDAVAVVQDDVERFNFRMGGKEGFGFGGGGTGGAGHGMGLSGKQFGQDFVESGDQAVNLTFLGLGADQHHIVEGRNQAAAVQKCGV